MSRLLKYLSIIMLAIPTLVFADDIEVFDSSINAGETVQWTADNTYYLNGFVFAEDGAELHIEAGTVIKAHTGSGENASALIISQGAKIFARGTWDRPIIFTSINDDVNDLNDLAPDERGLWGGVILLGYSTTNTADGGGYIEGIPEEPRTRYGGTDEMDNSGVMSHVSIRYGGSTLGVGDEINGLTFGAVGSGTTIEYIEVLNNDDDGYEWFGGTVNCKYLISAFNSDDAFDYDEGFRGKGQFWFVIQDPESAGRAAEMDGGTDPEDGQPYAEPWLYNVTYIGSGANTTSPNTDNDALIFRDNAGGHYVNSIIYDFGDVGLTVEDLDSGADSRQRLENGELSLMNNLWYNFFPGNNLENFVTQDFVRTHLGANNNRVEDPQLRGVDRTFGGGGLDPRPVMGSPAWEGYTDVPNDGFFTQTNYVGAFGYANWAKGWSFLWQAGYFMAEDVVDVFDSDINANDIVHWTSDKVYVLNGFVYAEEGAEVHIDPGTVIKAQTGSGENASALIISQGAKIFAEGTADAPIIFTSINDDVTRLDDLAPDERGLWGGVILLGHSTTNTADGGGYIEGIPEEPRTRYGGTDENDNSGIMRYVSIRYGGSTLGVGDEINGLTFGAVGSGTTIEYIEVYNNDDDGYEWFGGTVHCKYLISAFNSDDAFDYDEGFRGKGQFWFVIQDPENAGRAAEMDGGTDPEDGQPYSQPWISNVTYIGSGGNTTSPNTDNDAMIFRDNAGGHYYNSIIYGFGDVGLTVEDLDSGADSRQRLENGELTLVNNLWYNFFPGNNLENFIPQDFVRTHLTANGNMIDDPQFYSMSREFGSHALNPVPMSGSPAWGAAEAVPDGSGFFTNVDYLGAFGTNMWATEWSFLWEAGYLDLELAVEDEADDTVSGLPTHAMLQQNYPNPFNPSTTIRFALPQAGQVKLAVYNAAGQLVDTLLEGRQDAGNYDLRWNADHVPSGVYFYQLNFDGNTQTRKMILMK